MNEDTQMDFVNARLEMRAIKNEASSLMNIGDEEADRKLSIIHAFADNELYRLDRLEKDIQEA